MAQNEVEDETFLDSSTFVSTTQNELSTDYEPSLDDTPDCLFLALKKIIFVQGSDGCK